MTCPRYLIIPATSGHPEERWCTHPDTPSGDCCKEDCPMERPLTTEDVREWADEDKFEEEYERSGSRY